MFQIQNSLQYSIAHVPNTEQFAILHCTCSKYRTLKHVNFIFLSFEERLSARTKRTSCHELISLSDRCNVLKPAAASSRSGTSEDLLLSLYRRQTVTARTVRNTSNIIVRTTYKDGTKLS
jgi:hypothetical protein